MTAEQTGQSQKAEDARKAISGLSAGMNAVAAAMAQEPALRGEHVTELLDEPVKGDFGEFKKKWKYTNGCNLGSEILDGDVGAVVITTNDPGVKRVITVGPTPALWSPQAGGHSIEAHDKDAGKAGDFLMAVEKFDGTGKSMSFRYLDAQDLQDAVVRKQDTNVSLGQNHQRTRQIQIPGRVDSVVGLLVK